MSPPPCQSIWFWFATGMHTSYTHKRNTYTLKPKICRHNSRARINYWNWIRNSVDGQCTTWSSKCNVSNEKKYCSLPLSVTSHFFLHSANWKQKITTECDTHWRVPLCRYAIHLNFFFSHTTFVSKCKRTISLANRLQLHVFLFYFETVRVCV